MGENAQASWAERRREPRFPLLAQTSIHRRQGAQATVSGITADLSLHGLQCTCSKPIVPDEEVQLSFELPVSTATFSSAGSVIWCNEQKSDYRIGIRLFETMPLRFTLKDMESMLQEHVVALTENKYKYKSISFDQHEIHFYNEIYWGMLVILFNEALLNILNKLFYDSNLSAFYASQILNSQKTITENNSLINKNQTILNTLKRSKHSFYIFSKLLNYATEDKKNIHLDNIYQKIDFNYLVEESVEKLQKIMRLLMLPYHKRISFEASEPCSFHAYPKKTLRGIDILLLNMSHFFISGHATFLNINTDYNNGTVYLSLHSDGSKLLKQNYLILFSRNFSQTLQSYSADSKHIDWLQLVANMFIDQNGSIIVSSESGNNLVTLCLPLI